MKKNIKNLTIILLLLIILFFLIKSNFLIKKNIINTSKLFITQVFPSLFPMFILSSILINYGFVEILSYFFSYPFYHIFKINPKTAYIFIMSLLTGSPSNAKYTIQLVKDNYITKKDAEKILCFSFFANPIFIINSTFPIFRDLNIVLKIIFSLYVSNIFIGLIFRNFNKCNKNNKLNFKNILTNINQKTKKLNEILTSIIFDAIKTMLLIFSSMIIFSILSNIIIQLIPTNNFFKVLISGLLEMSNGLFNLQTLNISLYLKEILAITFLSFSGICIIFQIKSILNEENISLKYFILSRFIHVVFAILTFSIII